MGTGLLVNETSEQTQPIEQNCFYLEIIAQHGPVRQTHRLGENPAIIGRSPHRCDVVLFDPRISRVHLKVDLFAGQNVTVTDLYTANGTLFEGRWLTPGVPITWLTDQTVIAGSTSITLRYGPLENTLLE